MGFDTLVWGPYFWKLLFELSIHCGKSPITTRKFIILCSTLHHVLPCIYCRRSVIRFLQRVDVRNFLDGVKLHNEINTNEINTNETEIDKTEMDKTEIGNEENMLPNFVYEMKEQVNKKLFSQECPEAIWKTEPAKCADSYKPKLSLKSFKRIKQAPCPRISREELFFLLNIIVVDQAQRRNELQLHEISVFVTFLNMLIDLLPYTSIKNMSLLAPTNISNRYLNDVNEKNQQNVSNSKFERIKRDAIYVWFQQQKMENKISMDENYFLQFIQ